MTIQTFKFQCFQFAYTRILKPILFKFEAEKVHDLFTHFGRLLSLSPLTQMMTAGLFSSQVGKKYKRLDGITFPGPVGLAAGFDYHGYLPQILPSLGFGFETIGTVTYQRYEGNPKPRLDRFPNSKALLVNKGFKSDGALEIIKRLEGKKFSIPVGISIGSTNTNFGSPDEQVSDIVKSFTLFEASRVRHVYYELNISCPNTQGGQPFTTPARLEKLLRAVKKLKIKRPIYVKMPIDKTRKETLGLLRIMDRYPVAGVVFGNLTKDKTNPDVDKQDLKQWRHRQGNLSGKPTWHRSNELIALTKKEFGSRFTIVGTGGIFTPEDAAEKMRLGADLVQLITGMIFQGPQLISQINSYTIGRRF